MKTIVIFVVQLVRRIYLIMRKNNVPMTSRVDSNCTLTFCKIGNYCYIRSGAQFNHVIMGNYCSFAADVQIGGMEHPLDEYSTSAQIYRDKCVSDKDTILGYDVWVGAGSIIRQGVRIGNGAVIGANSFVNKDVPPYAIVVGSPARVLKYRFDESTIKRIEGSHYWDKGPAEARMVLNVLHDNIQFQ